MNHPDTLSQKYDHPLHMNKRGRRIVGTFAVGALIVTGAVMENTKHSESTPVKPLTEAQLFDNQINDAIQSGPIDTNLGTYEVGQDRTIANAIIQQSELAGRSIDLHTGDDLLSITLSANAFDKANGPSYQPEDAFVLFEQDVNNDGKKEILAKAIDSNK